MDRTLALGVDGWKMDGAAELIILHRAANSSRGTLSLRDYLDLYYRDTLHYSRAWKSDFVTMVRSVDIANSRGNDAAHAPFDAAPLTWVGDQRHSWKDKGLDEAVRSAFRALERDYPSVSSDTGGYQTASKDQAEVMPRLLYLRWAQWNALTPFYLIGGHDEHRPWKFDSQFFQIFRRYMWLHQELVPFFYSQHVQASLREGKLMHPGPGQHEFLLGDALLVGVMSDEQPRRSITFPPGTWLDYWDNKTQHRWRPDRRSAGARGPQPALCALGFDHPAGRYQRRGPARQLSLERLADARRLSRRGSLAGHRLGHPAIPAQRAARSQLRVPVVNGNRLGSSPRRRTEARHDPAHLAVETRPRWFRPTANL